MRHRRHQHQKHRVEKLEKIFSHPFCRCVVLCIKGKTFLFIFTVSLFHISASYSWSEQIKNEYFSDKQKSQQLQYPHCASSAFYSEFYSRFIILHSNLESIHWSIWYQQKKSGMRTFFRLSTHDSRLRRVSSSIVWLSLDDIASWASFDAGYDIKAVFGLTIFFNCWNFHLNVFSFAVPVFFAFSLRCFMSLPSFIFIVQAHESSHSSWKLGEKQKTIANSRKKFLWEN